MLRAKRTDDPTHECPTTEAPMPSNAEMWACDCGRTWAFSQREGGWYLVGRIIDGTLLIGPLP